MAKASLPNNLFPINLDFSEIPKSHGRNRLKDRTGLRSGHLVAVSYAGHERWWCRCDCGAIITAEGDRLQRNTATSCGCGIGDSRERRGGSHHPLYKVWTAMKQRCHNPNDKGYHRYGGRGIAVCQRWRESFAAFLEDMGERPEGMSVERINNDGNYEPSNCRWATYQEQNLNKRPKTKHSKNTPFVTYQGRTLSLHEWAEETGINFYTLESRKKHSDDPAYILRPYRQKQTPDERREANRQKVRRYQARKKNERQ